MTPKELAEIEARAEAAFPGPWEWRSPLDAAGPWAQKKRSRPNAKRTREWSDDVGDHFALLLQGVPGWHVEPKTTKQPSEIEGLDIFGGAVLGVHWPERKKEVEISGLTHKDRQFIAHARTDVPALVAEVRRLTTILAKAQYVADTLEKLSAHVNQQFGTMTTIAHGYCYAAKLLRDVVGAAEDMS